MALIMRHSSLPRRLSAFCERMRSNTVRGLTIGLSTAGRFYFPNAACVQPCPSTFFKYLFSSDFSDFFGAKNNAKCDILDLYNYLKILKNLVF